MVTDGDDTRAKIAAILRDSGIAWLNTQRATDALIAAFPVLTTEPNETTLELIARLRDESGRLRESVDYSPDPVHTREWQFSNLLEDVADRLAVLAFMAGTERVGAAPTNPTDDEAAFDAYFASNDGYGGREPDFGTWKVYARRDFIAGFRAALAGVVPAEREEDHILTVRPNPEMPSDQMLETIASDSIFGHWGGDAIALANADQREVDAVGYRAVWRHGCDAGMVAP